MESEYQWWNAQPISDFAALVVMGKALFTDLTNINLYHFSYGLSPPMIFTLKTPNYMTGLIYAGFALGLPYLVLFALNLATGLLIIRKRGKIRRRTSNLNNSNNNSRHSSEIKATITLLVMVLVFTLTTVPSLTGVSFYNGRTLDVKTDSYYNHGVWKHKKIKSSKNLTLLNAFHRLSSAFSFHYWSATVHGTS